MIGDDRPAWLEELQRAPGALPEGTSRPAPLLFDAMHRPLGTAEAWRARRAELHRSWLDFLGEIERPEKAPRLTTLKEEVVAGEGDAPAVRRLLVRYEAEPGLPVEGYLLRPEADEASRPGVVVLHSTIDYTIRQPAGLEGPFDKHIGLQLARRGYVALCPKNFLWQYGGPDRLGKAVEWLRDRHPGVTGMAKMLFDAVRAVDALAALPEVDATRLGAIGHSLGGKEVLYLAAFDERIRAAVSSEGGIGLSYSNWDAPWYLGEAIRRPGFPLDHGQVLAMAAPRAFLLIGGDSADGAWSWPYVEAALPVWRLLGVPDAVGLLNHGRGHEYPPIAQERAAEWLDWYLRAAG